MVIVKSLISIMFNLGDTRLDIFLPKALFDFWLRLRTGRS